MERVSEFYPLHHLRNCLSAHFNNFMQSQRWREKQTDQATTALLGALYCNSIALKGNRSNGSAGEWQKDKRGDGKKSPIVDTFIVLGLNYSRESTLK